MSDILEKEIMLTELGKIITTTLLLTNPCPYAITFVLFMKENKGHAKVKDLFDRYIGNSIGNIGYLSHVIKGGVDYDLFEVKK
ncbi:MAG TPA: hypothetical protein ACFYDZ_00215 [Candidatus Brocadiaceae bacterium]